VAAYLEQPCAIPYQEEITGTSLEIEPIVPEARDGPTRRPNLWAVCRYCNLLKSDRVSAADPETGTEVPLFNPRATLVGALHLD
jgi:hypothetical protein